VPDENRLSHLLVVERVEDREFRRRGGGRARRRSVNRAQHGRRLAREALAALAEAEAQRAELDEQALRAQGSIVVVDGADAVHLLKLEGLDHPGRRDWLLLSVHISENGTQHAVVWVNDRFRDQFLKLFEDYVAEETARGRPKNEALVVNIGRIRRALLRDLWQSDGDPPEEGIHWWEVWLRREEGAEQLLRRFAEVLSLHVAAEHLELDLRVILWVRASWEALTVLPATAVPVAEIRQAQFIDTIDDLDRDEQDELVEDLGDRIVAGDADAPAVCLLDTGTRRTHMLLRESLSDTDWHSVTKGGPGDVKGHGTCMAGLALLGGLDDGLLGRGNPTLLHRLESVKVLPDGGSEHEPRTYGLVTAQAVSLPEATVTRRRAFCLTITAPHEKSDEPSLWSAAIDALAAGTDVGLDEDGIVLLGPPDWNAARLFAVAAGNVTIRSGAIDYLDECDTSIIEDPAQVWNALVVGGFTELAAVPTDPSFAGWAPLADPGELSPHSRTGVLISQRWPVRPDVVLEAGNVLSNGTDVHDAHAALCLLTTGHRDDLALATANATSAATAQASRLAAKVHAFYPDYWPETVRGLIVHAADWTEPMRARVDQAGSVAQKRAVLGRYGWGIPRDEAVLSSSRQAVTMVVQDEFVPFTGADFTMRNFRLHQLPWPTDVLFELGASDVRLKVTLSYFIEPSAARRGWRNRYAYASHGLRFELKNTIENVNDFIRRVGRAAGDEEGGSAQTSSGAERWLMGPGTRNGGSLHQDIWTGSGAELAQCGTLAVYPVGGWWKNNSRRDRRDLPVRYALLVSLATKEAGVDIYTPIATEIAVDVEASAVQV
jgi:hypothetical protein